MHVSIFLSSWQPTRCFGLILVLVAGSLGMPGLGIAADNVKSAEAKPKPTVSCVAGCGATAPKIIQTSPLVSTSPDVGSDKPRKWFKPATGVWCYESGGCRGYSVGRHPNRPHRATVIMIFRDW